MNKIYAIILVTVGAALVVVGVSGPGPFDGALVDFFTHAPVRLEIWLFLAGIVLAAFGLYRAWSDRGRYD